MSETAKAFATYQLSLHSLLSLMDNSSCRAELGRSTWKVSEYRTDNMAVASL